VLLAFWIEKGPVKVPVTTLPVRSWGKLVYSVAVLKSNGSVARAPPPPAPRRSRRPAGRAPFRYVAYHACLSTTRPIAGEAASLARRIHVGFFMPEP